MRTGETLKGRISETLFQPLSMAAGIVVCCLKAKRGGSYRDGNWYEGYTKGWYEGELNACLLILRCNICKLDRKHRMELGYDIRRALKGGVQ